MTNRLVVRQGPRVDVTKVGEEFGHVSVTVGDRTVTIPYNPDQGIITSSMTSDTHMIGELVEGEGLYLGSITLPNKFGIELPEMDLWAAPEDLLAYTDKPLYYKGTISAVSGIQDWHGRDGVELKDRPSSAPDVSYEEALYRYFDKVVKGEVSAYTGWVIPTYEMFYSFYIYRNRIEEDNNLITRSPSEGYISDFFPTCYWLCNEPPEAATEVCYATIIESRNRCEINQFNKEDNRCSTRPFSMDLRL